MNWTRPAMGLHSMALVGILPIDPLRVDFDIAAQG
jgi:hypothetical protein